MRESGPVTIVPSLNLNNINSANTTVNALETSSLKEVIATLAIVLSTSVNTPTTVSRTPPVAMVNGLTLDSRYNFRVECNRREEICYGVSRKK